MYRLISSLKEKHFWNNRFDKNDTFIENLHSVLTIYLLTDISEWEKVQIQDRGTWYDGKILEVLVANVHT